MPALYGYGETGDWQPLATIESSIPATSIFYLAACHFGIWRGMLAGALVLFSLLVHECGHVYLARRMGAKTKAIGFGWLGAYTDWS